MPSEALFRTLNDSKKINLISKTLSEKYETNVQVKLIHQPLPKNAEIPSGQLSQVDQESSKQLLVSANKPNLPDLKRDLSEPAQTDDLQEIIENAAHILGAKLIEENQNT